MSLGPFDMTGGPFLILYGVLFVATIIAGFVIPRAMRPDGRPGRVTDEDQIAWLAGGKARFGDALVARLLAARDLVMTGKDHFSVHGRGGGATAAEKSVLALYPPVRWRDIEQALKPYVEPIARKLAKAGLLVTDGEHANLRFYAVLPYLMLFVFGATKWVIGDLRDRPIGFLSVLLIATFVFGIIRFFTIDRRARSGLDALENAKLQAQRLKAAPTAPEMGLAVALFGTVVLVGSGFDDFHKLRNASSGDSGSGGDGDGGGCSGGCGGCS
ncbi:TIGR04222 domain-containing membrane protein [Sphingosinicella sp. LHD-64]|uniref:TIGR04222 domain-containing membrane protein n=1 Tax=Sphingosinicella sp. LHD-64 TaxID=3072139 RepID=UPI00280E557B|nr:TIGR04222 domain-containing membrane protein [Sphingosinicella sp. LHD-64]MDQ8756464.1 TIGR04222 domain-containing membrane protein [Sphingosinicella sp. LHD-64]